MKTLDKNAYMRHALTLANRRRGFCAPNPAVGCVIVKAGKIIAEGYHQAAGQPHAEVEALRQLGEKAAGADLYVTLEPCCHWGKTPPCTQAIIQAKIKKVYYAFSDPNPRVSGEGENTLNTAGIECERLELPAVNDFYQSYAYWTRTQKPFVTAKLALSVDGFIAGPKGEPVEITGNEAKQFTFQNRLHSDAILTTINTIERDNPQLNVRLENTIIRKPIYILDSRLRFRLTAKIRQSAERIVLFHQKRVPKNKLDFFQKNGIQTIAVRHNKDVGLNLDDVLKAIGKAGVHDLWVEAGATCFNHFWQKGLMNRAYLYYAPKKLKTGLLAFKEPLPLASVRLAIRPLGEDTLLDLLWGE